MLTIMRKNWNHLALLVGMQSETAAVKTVCQVLQSLKIELPYYPGTPLLGVYSNTMKAESQRGICTLMGCLQKLENRENTAS